MKCIVASIQVQITLQNSTFSWCSQNFNACYIIILLLHQVYHDSSDPGAGNTSPLAGSLAARRKNSPKMKSPGERGDLILNTSPKFIFLPLRTELFDKGCSSNLVEC